MTNTSLITIHCTVLIFNLSSTMGHQITSTGFPGINQSQICLASVMLKFHAIPSSYHDLGPLIIIIIIIEPEILDRIILSSVLVSLQNIFCLISCFSAYFYQQIPQSLRCLGTEGWCCTEVILNWLVETEFQVFQCLRSHSNVSTEAGGFALCKEEDALKEENTTCSKYVQISHTCAHTHIHTQTKWIFKTTEACRKSVIYTSVLGITLTW